MLGGVVEPAARPLCPHLPHLGAGQGRLFRAGQGRRRPPAPTLQPGTSLRSLGKAAAPGQEWGPGRECGPRGSGGGHRDALLILRGPRPGAPSAGGCTVWKVKAPRTSRSMPPPRDVVKIAVQMRDAIPQLIQLDQVTWPVRPTSTPQPTSGSPPSHWHSPPHPFPRFSPSSCPFLAP